MRNAVGVKRSDLFPLAIQDYRKQQLDIPPFGPTAAVLVDAAGVGLPLWVPLRFGPHLFPELFLEGPPGRMRQEDQMSPKMMPVIP